MGSRDRFTRLTTRQINISDGDWLEVKEGLTYGEQQYLSNASLTSVHFRPGKQEEGASEIGLDMKRFAVLRLFVWITDWSFTQNGKRVAVTMPNIEALDPDTAQELNETLDQHIEDMRLRKNDKPALTAPELMRQGEPGDRPMGSSLDSREIIEIFSEGTS